MDDIKIIGNSIGHHINISRISQIFIFYVHYSAMGKSILRTSYLKIKAEPLQFFERIQGEICGPLIH